MDPAAVYHLTSEVSAQATVLASNQQQYQRLTSVTEELVKTLQALQLTLPPPTTPPPNPPVPEPQHVNPNVNPRLSLPEKFDGSPDKCKGFLLQCSVYGSTTTVIHH